MDVNQLNRLRNLNVELLENIFYMLQFIQDYCLRNEIPLPTEKGLMNLIKPALSVVREYNLEVAPPPSLQCFFQTPLNEVKILSDENLQVENPTQTLQNRHPHEL